jgi:hypothetical protein
MSNSVVPHHPARETPRALAIEPVAVLVPLGLFIAVVSIAAPKGSYFPSSWGWAALEGSPIAELADAEAPFWRTWVTRCSSSPRRCNPAAAPSSA